MIAREDQLPLASRRVVTGDTVPVEDRLHIAGKVEHVGYV